MRRSLTSIAGGSVSATFLYDADGNRVKGTVAGVTTVYVAGIYEYQNGAVTKYYEGGAMRRTGYATDNGVFYVVSDHLRSTSVLVNRDGTVKNRNFYYPYGGNRGGSAFSGITTKRFTGQYHEQGLPGGEGLSFYNARWYDAQVGMFISADTLVPSPLAPQTLNRYAYVSGNPLRYVDPTGHMLCADCDGGGGGYRTRSEPKRVWLPFISYQLPARPQPLAVRTPAPPATSVVQLPRTPVPTPSAFVGPIAPSVGQSMRAGPTRTPTLTPTATSTPSLTPTATPTLQPGMINGTALVSDWAWETTIEPLLVNMGLKTGIRAAGRGLGAIPVILVIGTGIALAASVGPNLYTNVVVDHAPARTVLLQAATDAIGVPVSMAGGAIATFLGGLAGLDPTDAALPLLGGMATSVLYDQFAAPRVYRRLDMGVSSLGW